MKRILFLSILSFIVLISCNEQKRYKTVSKKSVKVTRYKTTNGTQSTNDDLYWYFIGYSDATNSSYYYYSSPNAISDYRRVNWSYGKTNDFNKEEVEEEEIEEVDLADLESSVQTSVEENPEEMGETETTESEAESSESSDNSSESSGESSSDGGGDGGGD